MSKKRISAIPPTTSLLSFKHQGYLSPSVSLEGRCGTIPPAEPLSYERMDGGGAQKTVRPKLFDSGESCGNKALLRIPLPRRKEMPYKDKEAQREFQRTWIAKRRKRYVAEKGGKCTTCGSKKNLEFHHRDRDEKIDHKMWSWNPERIKEELSKCELLCHACHHEETAKERGYYTASHGTLTAYKDHGCRCKDCRAANAGYESRRRQERT
jgi:hypothetical protein